METLNSPSPEVITMNVNLVDEYNEKLIEAVATIDYLAGFNPHIKDALDDLREVYDFLYIQTNGGIPNQ